MDNEDTGLRLNDDTNENFIRDACERISAKALPKVENALDLLLDIDPMKGIIAWKEITEFSISKKRERPAPNTPPALQPPNITINMVPAQRREVKRKTIDIPLDDAEIVDDE
jgi:hypothetical protein